MIKLIDDLKEVGFTLKNIRKNKDMPQQDLANMVGVDQATVSRIEKGHQNITLEVYEKVLNGLNLSLYRNIEFNYQEYLTQLYAALECNDLISIKKIYQKAKRRRKIYYEDYPHHLLLLSYNYMANYRMIDLKKAIFELESFKNSFQGLFLLRYYHVVGIYNLMLNQYDIAASYFENAYNYCEKYTNLDGLLYYHYAWSQYMLLNFTTSLLALAKARIYFRQKNNEIRVMDISNLIGMIHLNDGNYDESEKIFSNCFRNVRYMQNKDNNYTIHRNLALTYFYQGNNEKAIYFLENLFKNEQYRTKTVIFFLLLSLKQTNNPKFQDYFEICQKINAPFINKILDIFQQDIYQIFNNASLKDLELMINKYHIYSFIKWIIDNASNDIYALRKYSTYKNLFDKFLELRVF